MSSQPREYDAVLGFKNKTASPTDAVLGGIEGVKRRIAAGDIESRIIALSQVLNYGEAGLDIVIQALQNSSKQIQWSAYQLLAQRTEKKVEIALQSFSLISEAGIDCAFLQYLLANEEWEKADKQTRKLVLQSVDRSDKWLRNEDIQSLGCEELFIIDRLWTIYSHGRFGFSVQKRIWESLDSEKWEKTRGQEFSDLVGWCKKETQVDKWGDPFGDTIKRRDDIPGDLNAPEGNLPSICEFGGGEVLQWYDPPDTESTMGFYWTGGFRYKWSQDSFFGATMIVSFLKRIQCCT